MNKTLETTLTSLIPTLAGPLPPELIQLTASLLAQSKNRISLKSGEEIAREYVCAHIACDRLRKQLDLPTITPHPPLAKKAYGALYNQFQKALPIRTRPAAAPTPATSSSTPPTTIPQALHAQIAALTISLSAPGAHRHVLAGVTAMLPESAPPKSPLPLVTAVTLLVIEKLLPEGKNVTVGSAGKWRRGEGYIMKRDGVMGALGGAGKGGFTKEDTDGWVKELSMRGVRELGWLKSIPDGAGLKVRAGDPPPPEVELVVGVEKTAVVAVTPAKARRKAAPVKRKTQTAPVQEEAVVASVKKQKVEKVQKVEVEKVEKVEKMESGIGTFMQGAVDYLSEPKRKGYKTWEGAILTRVGEIEKAEMVTAV